MHHMIGAITERQEVIFLKFSDRGRNLSTSVLINNEVKISEGRFGTIYEADISVGSQKKRFVLKRFKGSKEFAEEHANTAIQNYELAKGAGLKVFTTYRLGADKRTVLMTNGTTDTDFCIGSNKESPKIEEALGGKINNLSSDAFIYLIDGVFSQALLAEQKNIILPNDAYFFLIDKASKSKVDFIIGDLDTIAKKSDTEPERIINNVSYAMLSLQGFILRNINDPDTYLERAKEIYSETLMKNGLSNSLL
jgi:hypothetical protein